MRAVQGSVGLVLLIGCAIGRDASSSRIALDADPPDTFDAGDETFDPIARGRDAVRDRGCAACHASRDASAGDLSGADDPVPATHAYGANLTPDPSTGVGRWTDAALITALRDGLAQDGRPLCAMPHFTDVADDEAQAIVAYLRSLPAVEHVVASSRCHDEADAIEPTDATAFDVARCDAPVLINELMTEGGHGAGDEFVELYNAGGCTVDLAGWRLAYASLVGTAGTTRWTGRAGDTIEAHGYVVIAGVGFPGTAIGRFVGVRGALSSAGGGLALFDGDTRVDALGYGVLATNPYVQSRPAQAPGPSRSIARMPDGTDTHDGARDFAEDPRPTPGAPNG